jgi:hypothetical protein
MWHIGYGFALDDVDLPMLNPLVAIALLSSYCLVIVYQEEPPDHMQPIVAWRVTSIHPLRPGTAIINVAHRLWLCTGWVGSTYVEPSCYDCLVMFCVPGYFLLLPNNCLPRATARRYPFLLPSRCCQPPATWANYNKCGTSTMVLP